MNRAVPFLPLHLVVQNLLWLHVVQGVPGVRVRQAVLLLQVFLVVPLVPLVLRGLGVPLVQALRGVPQVLVNHSIPLDQGRPFHPLRHYLPSLQSFLEFHLNPVVPVLQVRRVLQMDLFHLLILFRHLDRLHQSLLGGQRTLVTRMVRTVPSLRRVLSHLYAP